MIPLRIENDPRLFRREKNDTKKEGVRQSKYVLEYNSSASNIPRLLSTIETEYAPQVLSKSSYLR